jgi:hypothetical protein
VLVVLDKVEGRPEAVGGAHGAASFASGIRIVDLADHIEPPRLDVVASYLCHKPASPDPQPGSIFSKPRAETPKRCRRWPTCWHCGLAIG